MLVVLPVLDWKPMPEPMPDTKYAESSTPAFIPGKENSLEIAGGSRKKPEKIHSKIQSGLVWIAKPWSGSAHRVRSSFPPLTTPLEDPPTSAARGLCGVKIISHGGLMEFSTAYPPEELRTCTSCERIFRAQLNKGTP